MFTITAVICIAHDHVDKDKATYKFINGDCRYKLVHKLAIGFDLLLGITVLVVSALSVAAPHLGISLSPAAQWALIGAGGTYTGFMLGIGLIALGIYFINKMADNKRADQVYASG